MINAINIGILRNAEYLQFIKNITTLVDQNNPVALNVAAQHAALITKATELEALFKMELSNPITQELVLLDERRDKCINGITSIVNGFTYHFNETIRTAATALNDNLKLYGAGIAVQNYQSETATLNSIINDWENKPNLTNAMTVLNLTDWKNELKSINLLFDQKYIARTQEYGAASPENIKSKREETNAVYYQLRQFIDAYGVINSNNPIYSKTTSEINALIDQYNTLLTNRQSHNSTNNGQPNDNSKVTP